MIRLLTLAVILVSCNGLHYRHNNRQTSAAVQEPLVTKSFYFFASPDDVDFRRRSGKRITSSVKKNVEVVVIKAPEYSSYADTVVNLAREGQRKKTVVYVLSKEPDTREVVRTYTQSHKSPRPEVRFIKFKTAEEEKRFLDAIGTSRFDASSVQPNSLEVAGAPVYENADTTPPAFDSNSYDDDELFTARHPPFLPTGVDVVPGSSYLPPKRD